MSYTMAGILFILITAAASWLLVSHNILAECRGEADDKWLRLYAVLQRRNGLIPDWVDRIQCPNSQVRMELMRVLELKTGFDCSVTASDAMESARETGLLLKDVFRICRLCPGIAEDKDFISLQGEFISMEEKTDMLYTAYNDAVEAYNKKVLSFPHNIAAAILSIKTKA